MNKEDREALVQYRMARAIETLQEAKLLNENGFWNTAVNRLYYACFYAVGALLISHEYQTQTHNGIKILFNQHFVKTGKISLEMGILFSELFDKRQKGDYSDLLNWDKNQVEALMQPTNEFVNCIEEFLK
jgi:uncharacterized protein (UPF0332 family)